jgi:SAM-dependent methyltransferase
MADYKNLLFGFAKSLIEEEKAELINAYDNQYMTYANAIKRSDDIAFYVDKAQHCGGRVLELGCGYGRLLLEIAAHGIAIDGLDISESQILQLKSEVAQQAYDSNVWVQDMTEFCVDRIYNMIFISFGALGYLENDAKCRITFENVYRHLKKGGVFVFDFDPNYGEENAYGPFVSQQFVSNEVWVRSVTTKGLDSDRRLCNIITYMVGEGESRITVESTVEKKYKYENIISTLTDIGFHVKEVYNNYQKTPYSHSQSEECVVVAIK